MDYAEQLRRAADSMRHFLNVYDDDVEDQKGEDEWYTDRQRWVDKRRYLLKNEADRDEQDRRREREEQRQGNKRRSERRSHSPVDVKRHKPDTNGRKDQNCDQLRSHLRRELLDGPLSVLLKPNADLFAFGVDWDAVGQNAIEAQLRPAIEDKICQFLGGSEPDLVDFIVEAILPKKDATHAQAKDYRDVLQEIKIAFGEGEEEERAADDLVRQVWRIIIWEQEKRKLAVTLRLDMDSKPIEKITIDECLH